MDDLRTRAQLVAYDRAGTSIGTVVTRDEIAAAAAGTEFPATLLLDIDKVEPAVGGEVAARATVAVDWDQETLEQLASIDDEEIALWFDERELALAFDDVEAHGLRERAAVITVAVAAAGLSASPALARSTADTGGGGAVTPATVSVNPQTGVSNVPVGGGERALVQDEKLTQGLGNTGSAVIPQATGHAAVPMGVERGLLQDQQLGSVQAPDTSAPAASSSGGSALSTAELAAAVAGGALLIAAAGFGATHRRTPPALPA